MTDITKETLAELRAAAEKAANSDDMGGVWCYTHWAEKSNDSSVLAALRYDANDVPSRGRIDNDPDFYYSEVIAACEDDLRGGLRAQYIALACPATILALLDRLESLSAPAQAVSEPPDMETEKP